MEELRNIVAMVTPFVPVEVYDPRRPPSVDYDRAQELANKLVLEEKVDGLVVAGTTGSAATLTDEEQLSLFAAVTRDLAPDDIICGTGSNDTRHLIELTGKAIEMGFYQFLLVTPYYNKTSQRGLYCHYAAVLERFPEAEFILYCIRGRTGQITQPDTIAQLARDFPNLIGIKDADGVDHAQQVYMKTGNRLRIYSGNDDDTFEMMKRGFGYGVIGVDNILFPQQRGRMINLMARNQRLKRMVSAVDIEEAMEIDEKLKALSALLMSPDVPNPAGIRYLVNRSLMGIGLDRLPQVEPPETMKRDLDSAYMIANSNLSVSSMA